MNYRLPSVICKLDFYSNNVFIPPHLQIPILKIKALVLSSVEFSKDYSGKEEVINTIMDAILTNETCYVTYHSFYDDEVKRFAIDPLHLFEYEGGLYLYVNTTSFGDILTLAVERIQKIKKTGDHYQYPADFDPDERIGSVFDIISGEPVDVKIWFSPDQARYIKERQWARNQRIEDQEDGAIILAITVSSEYTLLKWVLSQGAEAKLLEPAGLKEKLIEELRKINSLYQS
jgi:predicted DNA-binding transcriptional regulator YafY